MGHLGAGPREPPNEELRELTNPALTTTGAVFASELRCYLGSKRRATSENTAVAAPRVRLDHPLVETWEAEQEDSRGL
jgi:hypothetical protein